VLFRSGGEISGTAPSGGSGGGAGARPLAGSATGGGGAGIRPRSLPVAGDSDRLALSAGSSASVAGWRGATRGLTVEDVVFSIRDAGALVANDVEGLVVRGCRVTLEPLLLTLADDANVGRNAALFVSGSDLLVERCSIVGDHSMVRQRLPVGGVHVGGPSERVTLRDNVVHGGNGAGITLGSVRWRKVEAPPDDPGFLITMIMVFVDENGCIVISGTPPEAPAPDDDLVAESAGVLQDVRIERNDIVGCGASGITSYVFAGLGADELGDAVAVERLEIVANRIVGCVRNEIGTVPPMLRQIEGWGGIALSVCADGVIRDNLIEGNGSGSTDPVTGIFLAVAEDVRIERNRIERNGGRAPDDGSPLAPGRRDGIAIGIAIGGLSTYGTDNDPERPSDRPALLVAGNTVDSPAGRALRAIAMGPVIVLGNRLVGAGRSALFSNVFNSLAKMGARVSLTSEQVLQPRTEIDLDDYAGLELLADVLGGDVVNLVNLGISEEFADLASAMTGLDEPSEPDAWRGGEMLINDNQLSLRRHSEDFAITVSAVMLLSGDDVSFQDNQAEIENSVLFAFTNVLAMAPTLRVSGNRLQKRLLGGFISAVTLGGLNQTSLNQSTHCLFAVGFGAGRVVTGNASLTSLALPQLCRSIDRLAENISEVLRIRNGYAKAQATTGT